MRTAPKCPCCTRSDGQPMLRFISSYPRSSHTRAACAMICASSPPNCTASGLSEGSKSRMRLRYASLMLQLVLHVLHSPQRCIAIDATRANDSAAHSFPMNRIRNDHLREKKGVPADPAEKKAEVPDQKQPPACQVVRDACGSRGVPIGVAHHGCNGHPVRPEQRGSRAHVTRHLWPCVGRQTGRLATAVAVRVSLGLQTAVITQRVSSCLILINPRVKPSCCLT